MEPFSLDANFPGGNILLERIQGDQVFIRQDLRDTIGDWFYWSFRVRGAANRTLTFHFTGSDVIGVHGPALSPDGGQTWQWLGTQNVSRHNGYAAFTHTFAPDQNEVHFAFCPSYTQTNLNGFLERHPNVKREVLCHSRQGREVELLRLTNESAPFRLLLLARHHACETMASFCLEGILERFLAADETGYWLRQNVDVAAIPFMDKDGVEAGDQGKNRAPHDHNRDYGGDLSDCLYPEVKALRQWAPQWMAAPTIVLDMHCPWIRGARNEEVYFVGGPNPTIWQQVTHFSHHLETNQVGPLPFHERNNLPWGQDWNTLSGQGIGQRSNNLWAESLPQTLFSTSLEVPYANAGGAEVTPESSRVFGRDIAGALFSYLSQPS